MRQVFRPRKRVDGVTVLPNRRRRELASGAGGGISVDAFNSLHQSISINCGGQRGMAPNSTAAVLTPSMGELLAGRVNL
jgi:hypothetical protein